uniref:Membrane transporter n=1 Tax=Caenorhabditis tropicalis TaxID=1561998 RepID=A0A1I7UKB5_9PELO
MNNGDSLVVPDSEDTTNWRLIIVAGIVSALNAVENSVVGMGEWPYMKEIDKDATAQFFGMATSASKCGHALFALVFSIWSYKTHSVKIPLLASRLIAIVACMIYLSIEYVPDGKRYVLMSVYILLGIANSSFRSHENYSKLSVSSGATTVLRGYIAMCSSTQDRPRAFAVIGLSIIVSIVVGPMLQLIFSSIPYPGYQIIAGIRFHIYSAPIWFSFILTILTVFFIAFFLQDVHRASTESKLEEESARPIISVEQIKDIISKLKRSNLDWRLIAVCLFVKIAGTFSHATMQSIMSILFMVQYGWSGTETVRMGSMLMVGFGVLSCVVLLLYIFCRLGQILPQEKVFLVCTIASGCVFLITYPYEFNSSPVVLYNETTHAGCNPLEYSWCETAMAVNPYFFMILTILVSAPSIPMMHTALDTVYSRILGNVDQSVAQGAMTIVDDIVFMVTPVFTTTLFTLLGVGPLWIIKSSVFFAIAAVWFLNLKKIRTHMY